MDQSTEELEGVVASGKTGSVERGGITFVFLLHVVVCTKHAA